MPRLKNVSRRKRSLNKKKRDPFEPALKNAAKNIADEQTQRTSQSPPVVQYDIPIPQHGPDTDSTNKSFELRIRGSKRGSQSSSNSAPQTRKRKIAPSTIVGPPPDDLPPHEVQDHQPEDVANTSPVQKQQQHEGEESQDSFSFPQDETQHEGHGYEQNDEDNHDHTTNSQELPPTPGRQESQNDEDNHDHSTNSQELPPTPGRQDSQDDWTNFQQLIETTRRENSQEDESTNPQDIQQNQHGDEESRDDSTNLHQQNVHGEQSRDDSSLSTSSASSASSSSTCSSTNQSSASRDKQANSGGGEKKQNTASPKKTTVGARKSAPAEPANYTEAELQLYRLAPEFLQCNFCKQIFHNATPLRLHVAGLCPKMPLSRYQVVQVAFNFARNGWHPPNHPPPHIVKSIVQLVHATKRFNPKVHKQADINGTGIRPHLVQSVINSFQGHQDVIIAPMKMVDFWLGRKQYSKKRKPFALAPISFNLPFEELLKVSGVGVEQTTDGPQYFWTPIPGRPPRFVSTPAKQAAQLQREFNERNKFAKLIKERISAKSVRRVIFFVYFWDAYDRWMMATKTREKGGSTPDESNKIQFPSRLKAHWEKPNKPRNHCSLLVVDINYTDTGPQYIPYWFESYVKTDKYYRYVLPRNRCKFFNSFLNKLFPFQKAALVCRENIIKYPNTVPHGCVSTALFFAIMCFVPTEEGNLRDVKSFGHPNHWAMIAGLTLFLREFLRHPSRKVKTPLVHRWIQFLLNL